MKTREQEVWIETSDGRLFAKTWQPHSTRTPRTSAILLLHDSLGCVKLWRDFPQLLSERTGRTVVAYDRLGFGRSTPAKAKLPSDFIRHEAIKVIPMLLRELGVAEFIACGHSVGGAMAIEAAAHLQHLCQGVVTLGAQAFVTEQTIFGVQAAKSDFEAADEFRRLQRYHGDSARWVLDAWTETWLSGEFKNWTLDEPLAGVVCPILAVHGDRDEYGPIDHAVRIAGDSGEMRILKAIGHSPHRQDPVNLSAIIAEFIRDKALP